MALYGNLGLSQTEKPVELFECYYAHNANHRLMVEYVYSNPQKR